MAHPRTAVRGNQSGMLGLLLAIVATLLSERLSDDEALVRSAAAQALGE